MQGPYFEIKTYQWFFLTHLKTQTLFLRHGSCDSHVYIPNLYCYPKVEGSYSLSNHFGNVKIEASFQTQKSSQQRTVLCFAQLRKIYSVNSLSKLIASMVYICINANPSFVCFYVQKIASPSRTILVCHQKKR